MLQVFSLIDHKLSQFGDGGGSSNRYDSFCKLSAKRGYILCNPCIRKPGLFKLASFCSK